jgi:hypothetical protein
MSQFEETLKRALRREAAPEGFAERVLACPAASPPRVGVLERLRLSVGQPVLRWAGVAMLAVLLLAAFLHRAQQRERAQGELAKRSVLMALQITADKLEFTRERVVRLTSGGDRP